MCSAPHRGFAASGRAPARARRALLRDDGARSLVSHSDPRDPPAQAPRARLFACSPHGRELRVGRAPARARSDGLRAPFRRVERAPLAPRAARALHSRARAPTATRRAAPACARAPRRARPRVQQSARIEPRARKRGPAARARAPRAPSPVRAQRARARRAPRSPAPRASPACGACPHRAASRAWRARARARRSLPPVLEATASAPRARRPRAPARPVGAPRAHVRAGAAFPGQGRLRCRRVAYQPAAASTSRSPPPSGLCRLLRELRRHRQHEPEAGTVRNRILVHEIAAVRPRIRARDREAEPRSRGDHA